MRLETDLMKYLPVWYRQILDYQQLCQTESQQFEGLALAVNAIGDNFFFQTAGLDAIALWEKVLHIVPNPSTEDLEFRRARVINRISTKPPFTLGFLYRKLDELIGPGLWNVAVDYPNYSLYIESGAQNQNYYGELVYTVGKIKPAHIVWVNRPFVRAGLELTEEIRLRDRVYNYHLGGWGLGLLPFGQETDKGVIKTAETPSIQPQLLNDSAAFVASDVAMARVNGTLLITNLTKTVEGDTATISYPVFTGDVGTITKVELLDAQQRVLTASPVYVPVGTNTVMKHIIPVQEGA